MSMYEGMNIILATMHKKEDAIREPFASAFNAKIVVPDNYDTDQFGTFTGEIPRIQTPYETVIQKAKQASLIYGFDYAVSNEGSFGPHPVLFFAPADIELMSFIDIKNDITVVESEISTDTNYAHLDIEVTDTYGDFLKKIKFPSHGIIIRCMDNNIVLAKRISDSPTLEKIISTSFKEYKKLRLETDMRAMMNPSRMNIIYKLAIKLVERLQNICDHCQSPGFGKISTKGNLSCEMCGTETLLYQFKVHSCVKCDYQKESSREDGLIKADQKYCPYCNP